MALNIAACRPPLTDGFVGRVGQRLNFAYCCIGFMVLWPLACR
jgi:hypothetical protein